MNIRSGIHLIGSVALGLVLALTGLAWGGPALAVLGFILWLTLEQLIRALLPASFLPGVEGAQSTSAAYRGWAAQLAGALGLAKGRTVQADAARLEAGMSLWMPSFGCRDGSQTWGYLLLRRSPAGVLDLAWRNRGPGQPVQPIATGKAALRHGRRQQNAAQARAGFTTCVEIGTGSYWLRVHDAELLEFLSAQDSGAGHLPAGLRPRWRRARPECRPW